MVAIYIIAGILGLAYSIVMLLAVLDIQKSLKQLVRWEEERDIKARREH